MTNDIRDLQYLVEFNTVADFWGGGASAKSKKCTLFSAVFAAMATLKPADIIQQLLITEF